MKLYKFVGFFFFFRRLKVLQGYQGSLQQKDRGNAPDLEEKVTRGRILFLLNVLEGY